MNGEGTKQFDLRLDLGYLSKEQIFAVYSAFEPNEVNVEEGFVWLRFSIEDDSRRAAIQSAYNRVYSLGPWAETIKIGLRH